MDFANIILIQTIISVSVWVILIKSLTILNSILTVLARKDENIYILYQRSLKCYYGNISSVPDLRVLRMKRREKLEFIEIFIGGSY